MVLCQRMLMAPRGVQLPKDGVFDALSNKNPGSPEGEYAFAHARPQKRQVSSLEAACERYLCEPSA